MQEAEDPRTLPGRLREIADWGARDLPLAVAAHPNAPPDLLRRLVVWHPEAVLRNPALPLVLLEDPDWANGISPRLALRLLCSEDAPTILVSALAAWPGQVGQAARLHVGLAGECGADWEDEAGEALWEASGLPDKEAHEAAWGAADLRGEEGTFPARLVSLGLVAPWLLGVLAAHDDPAVRRAVAHSPHAPRDLLALLRRAGSRHDLSGPAPPDPALPASDLTWLARGGPWAKRLAARHPNTPPAVLERLTREGGESLSRPPVQALVQSPDPPAPPVVDKQEAMKAMRDMELAACRGWAARAAMVANPHVPARHLVGWMMTDLHWPSRLAVARNPVMLLPELGRPEDGDGLARLALVREAATLLPERHRPEAGDDLAMLARDGDRLARDGNRLVRAAARAALRHREARP